ncbi:inositol monophosphatase family protein [Nesterenkonia sp. Act20]|uniref:inositol monophosphatase family protein n=1 Tax=Nesterenkonia sp. Act20 TaxID=1483432 RepID=UPI001C47CBCA|nr:inositol monophosphatase family protein [Nesterenkonia sp. Act20]
MELHTQTARAALIEASDLLDSLMPKLDALRTELEFKADDTPVTAADLLLQQELETLLRARLSNLTFVGEEESAGWEAKPTGWVAVVDPIDGTENFASSLVEWGTAISIFHSGVHSASMIALPELGQRIISGDTLKYAQSRIAGFSSGMDQTLVDRIAEAPQARIYGAAVYNFFGVVTGRLASFTNPVGAYSWDVLAGLPLAREHNCEVFVDDEPYDGRYLEPGRRYRVEVHHRYDRHPRQGSLG